mmetsp:Transcript_49934/g.118113  ORF Transcript_49934/g.118113 Transcript_49934/m.118113 type:complete len:336 (+) Transcript_49934:79-1086(+)
MACCCPSWFCASESVKRTNRDWVREFNGESAALLSGLPYLVVRALLAGLMILLMLGSILDSDGPGYWSIYLTYWTVLVETVYFVVSVSASHLAVGRRHGHRRSSVTPLARADGMEMSQVKVVGHDGRAQHSSPDEAAPPGGLQWGLDTPNTPGEDVLRTVSVSSSQPSGSQPLGDVGEDGPRPLLVVAHTYLFATAWPMTVSITLLYWFLLAANAKEIKFMTYMAHGGTNALIIVDTLFSGHTFHLTRVWPTFVIAAAYTVFTRIYALAGGMDMYGNNYVYSILDWTNGAERATFWALLAIFVVTPASVVFAWGFCKMRGCCIPRSRTTAQLIHY